MPPLDAEPRRKRPTHHHITTEVNTANQPQRS
jgi:hypothetical protein